MKIYTKTGDKGETSLFGGKRVLKADLRVEVYGTMDELQAILGVVQTHLKRKQSIVNNYLTDIETDLFELCFVMATPTVKSVTMLPQRIAVMEQSIDTLTEKLPLLKNFIYPNGGQAGALLHLSRAVCRRLERRLVALSKKEEVDNAIIMYFNRLSDLLFTMARFVNHQEGKTETLWRR